MHKIQYLRTVFCSSSHINKHLRMHFIWRFCSKKEVMFVSAGGKARVCWYDQRGCWERGRQAGNRFHPSGGRDPFPHRQWRSDVQRNRGSQPETQRPGAPAGQHWAWVLKRNLRSGGSGMLNDLWNALHALIICSKLASH